MAHQNEYSQIIREMVRYENELINHRFTWLAALQGLLFAAVAFAWGKSETDSLVVIFCIVGGLVALSIGASMYRSNRAIDKIVEWWDNNKPKDYVGPDVEGVRSSSGRLWWLMPGRFIPWVFLVAWLVVLCVHLQVVTANHPPS